MDSGLFFKKHSNHFSSLFLETRDSREVFFSTELKVVTKIGSVITPVVLLFKIVDNSVTRVPHCRDRATPIE